MIEYRETTTNQQNGMQDDLVSDSPSNSPAKGSLKSLLNRLDRDAPDRTKVPSDPALGLREARMKMAELTGVDKPSALSQLKMGELTDVDEPSALSQLATLKSEEAARADRAKNIATPAVGAGISDALSDAIAEAPQSRSQVYAFAEAPPNFAPHTQEVISPLNDIASVPAIVETEYEEEDKPRSGWFRPSRFVLLTAAVGGVAFYMMNPDAFKGGSNLFFELGSVLAGKARPDGTPVLAVTSSASTVSLSGNDVGVTANPALEESATSKAQAGVPSSAQPAAPVAPAPISNTEKDGISAVVKVRPGDSIPLPINLDPIHVSADVSAVLIRGLPADYSISGATGAGEGRWALLAESIQDARLEIPATGAGRVTLNVDMFNAEAQRIAQTSIAVEVAAQNAHRRLSEEQMKQLLSQGNGLFAAGDVAAARLLFERAAEGGHGPSAFAMAETFEAERLKSMSVQGLTGDPARARFWYEKAHVLGIPQAGERLAKLKTQ